MKEIKYVDLRVFYYPGVQLDILGSGQLKNKDIIELALQLQETISHSNIDIATKQQLMELPLTDFIAAVKSISEQFINVQDTQKENPAPSWGLSPLLDPQMDREIVQQTLDTYKSMGQCKCPRCGVKLVSIDGEVKCLNCGFNCGTIE